MLLIFSLIPSWPAALFVFSPVMGFTALRLSDTGGGVGESKTLLEACCSPVRLPKVILFGSAGAGLRFCCEVMQCLDFALSDGLPLDLLLYPPRCLGIVLAGCCFAPETSDLFGAGCAEFLA